MKKIQNKRYRKYKIIIICTVCVSMIIYGSHSFNQYMEPRLLAIAKQHTGFAINNIVKEVLADLQIDQEGMIHISSGSDGNITNITYDSKKLNEILYSALNTIDESLLAAQDGKKDPTTKDVFYEDGVLYEVPMGYFTHLYFLYNVGPKVKVRMKMINDVTGEIKTETKPYGINSTLLTISLVVKVNVEVLTFLHTTPLASTCKIPIVIQIINGKVPNVTPYMNSSQ